MPGIDPRCSALHHEHVAAVAIGDDGILQIARGVALPRTSDSSVPRRRVRAPQLVADLTQLGAGVVAHVAGGVDRAAHLADLALETGATAAPGSARIGIALAGRLDDQAAATDRSTAGNRPASRSRSGSSGRPSTVRPSSVASRSDGARRGGGRRGVAEEPLTAFGGLGEREFHFGSTVLGTSFASLAARAGSARSWPAPRGRDRTREREGCLNA